jgi:polysaccharide biosynthesis protein PslG
VPRRAAPSLLRTPDVEENMRSPSSGRARRAATIALVAGVASCMLGTTLASAGASHAQPPTFVLRKANFGLAPGTGFFLDQAHIRKGLDDFETLGVHWIRSSIPWQNFQPDDPQHLPAGTPEYNWRGVDQFIATMNEPASRGHFRLIVTVDSPPAWAKVSKRIGHIACPDQAPFDLPSYAQAIAALAEHLKASAHVFELENSPNIGARSPKHANPVAVWPTPNPCGYAQLLKLTTPAVHALHVGATVLVGGIGGTQDVPNQRMAADHFLAELYAYGARGAFDGVAYHAYSTPQLPCAPSATECVFDPNPSHKDPYGMTNGWDRMLNARRIMLAAHDGAKRIWITEFGGPTDGPKGAGKVLTEPQQAALLIAGFERASQYPWIAEMCWFTYDDKGGNPQSDPTGGWMGLLRKDGTRKPSFGAYERLTASAK